MVVGYFPLNLLLNNRIYTQPLTEEARGLTQYKPRIEDRTKAMVRARLRGAGAERDACILDLSSRGLSATADDPPRRGDYVELLVGEAVLLGQVKWSSERRFGMAFRERISVISVLSGEGGAVTLKHRETVRKQADRKRNAPGAVSVARRIEYAVVFAAGAAATFVLADYAQDALRPMQEVRLAMAASHAG